MLPLVILLVSVGQPVQVQQAPPAARREQHTSPAPANVAELEAQTARNPDDPKAWVLLGLAYLDRSESAKALEALQRAVKTGPQSAEAHN